VLGVHDTNRLRDVRTPTLRQQSSLSMTVLNKIEEHVRKSFKGSTKNIQTQPMKV